MATPPGCPVVIKYLLLLTRPKEQNTHQGVNESEGYSKVLILFPKD